MVKKLPLNFRLCTLRDELVFATLTSLFNGDEIISLRDMLRKQLIQNLWT